MTQLNNVVNITITTTDGTVEVPVAAAQLQAIMNRKMVQSLLDHEGTYNPLVTKICGIGPATNAKILGIARAVQAASVVEHEDEVMRSDDEQLVGRDEYLNHVGTATNEAATESEPEGFELFTKAMQALNVPINLSSWGEIKNGMLHFRVYAGGKKAKVTFSKKWNKARREQLVNHIAKIVGRDKHYTVVTHNDSGELTGVEFVKNWL